MDSRYSLLNVFTGFRRESREKENILEKKSRLLGEDEGPVFFCGHADPAFLFSSQDSTKIQSPERPFKPRILGFYLFSKWIR